MLRGAATREEKVSRSSHSIGANPRTQRVELLKWSPSLSDLGPSHDRKVGVRQDRVIGEQGRLGRRCGARAVRIVFEDADAAVVDDTAVRPVVAGAPAYISIICRASGCRLLKINQMNRANVIGDLSRNYDH